MKTGETFTHKTFIDRDKKPMQCKITAIRNGYVYYHSEGDVKWKMKISDYLERHEATS